MRRAPNRERMRASLNSEWEADNLKKEVNWRLKERSCVHADKQQNTAQQQQLSDTMHRDGVLTQRLSCTKSATQTRL